MIRILRSKLAEVRHNFDVLRENNKSALTQFNDKDLEGFNFPNIVENMLHTRSLYLKYLYAAKNLHEKCVDLETNYFQKCEHLNALEREIYSTKVGDIALY